MFACVVEGYDPEELQSALDITVLRRFAEYHDLAGRIRAPGR